MNAVTNGGRHKQSYFCKVIQTTTFVLHSRLVDSNDIANADFWAASLIKTGQDAAQHRLMNDVQLSPFL